MHLHAGGAFTRWLVGEDNPVLQVTFAVYLS